jgi:hypothetical protein
MFVPVIPEQILSKIPNLASSWIQIERVILMAGIKRKKKWSTIIFKIYSYLKASHYFLGQETNNCCFEGIEAITKIDLGYLKDY